MVGKVAGNDIGQGANCERIVAGDAASCPGLSGQVAEERQSGHADRSKLVDVVGPRNVVGLSGCYANVLIEAGQLILKTTRKPQSPGNENALRVVDVT